MNSRKKEPHLIGRGSFLCMKKSRVLSSTFTGYIVWTGNIINKRCRRVDVQTPSNLTADIKSVRYRQLKFSFHL